MRDGFYQDRRHLKPAEQSQAKWITGYEMEGAELSTLNSQNPDVVFSQIILLSAAQATSLEINVPGRAVTLYGFPTNGQYNPVTNVGTEPKDPGVFVECRVNFDRPENAFPLKHNRGFRGTFQKLYLRWPAQANLSAKIVIFKFDACPMPNSENDDRFSGLEASNITTHAQGSVGNTAAVLLAADLSRKVSTIQNNSANDIYVGDSGVTTTTGIKIAANGGIAYWRNTAALYAIAGVVGPSAINLATEY